MSEKDIYTHIIMYIIGMVVGYLTGQLGRK